MENPAGLIGICAFSAFLFLLICASITDIKRRIIPNWVIFGTVFLWIAWSVVRFALGIDAPIFLELLRALVVFSLLLELVAISERIAKKYLFGGGDIKLVSTCALFLAFGELAIALLVASLASLVYAVARRNNEIPFAPCMLLGTLAATMA